MPESTPLEEILSAIQALQQTVDEVRSETISNRQDITNLRDQMVGEKMEKMTYCDEESQKDEEEELTSEIVYPSSENFRLYDLPKFSGSAEQWPLFHASYVDSTKAFKYTNRHNLMRLQKCLLDEAKEAVHAMLIYPSDVPAVMEELEFRYGRPDLLVRSQLEKIQQFDKLTEKNIDNLIALSSLVRNVVVFLSLANCEHHLSNTTLLEQLVCKLPPSKQFEWARHAVSLKHHPTVKEFSVWLSKIAKIIWLLPQPSPQPKPEKSKNIAAANQSHPRRVMHAQNNEIQQEAGQRVSMSEVKCVECSGSHFITKCDNFLKNMNVQQRWARVKQFHLCFSCLRKGHNVVQCRSKKQCGINGCRKNHNKLLHEPDQQSTRMSPTQESAQQVLSCAKPSSGFLFKLVPITILGPKGQLNIFALMHEGSSVTMLDSNTACQLGLKGKKQPLTLQWYDNEVVTQQSTVLNINIKNEMSEQFEIKNVHTVENLSLPIQTFKKSAYSHFECIPIKDYNNVKPLMLLCLNCANITASSTLVSASESEPVAILTKLGWVVYGPTCSDVASNLPLLCIRSESSLKSLNRAVSEFFNTENFGIEIPLPPLEAADDTRAHQILADTICRINDRYEIGLLWKEDSPILPDSFAMAVKRLENIESKMKININFAEKYSEEINKYIEKGYAKKLTEAEIENITQPMWFLPHFAVQTPHKPNKLRIVFDAAAKVNQQSLNSALLKGPEQAKPLLGILFKFRQGCIAVAADIKEMFSQVKIREADQNAQRFLWRSNENVSFEQYVMTSMIFGAICCCAEFIKNYNAEIFLYQYPEAVSAIIEKFYVDDFVCSFYEETKALTIRKQVVQINKHAGFELRNFSSNSLKIKNVMNKNDNDQAVSSDRHSQTEKILGMFWNVNQDSFQFLTKFHRICKEVIENQRPPTKRELLGIVMAIFDPFGLLADCLLFAKVLLQETWKANLNWNEILPPSLSEKWFLWWNEFATINNFNVPRCYAPHIDAAEDIQIHVFMDASQVAFSAVTYLRIECQETVYMVFVCGKTRTAPQKLLSMPRLELQAAVLATRLSKVVKDSHDITFNRITFWSDSKTVLSWVHSKNRRFKPFVGHRIAEILSSTDEKQWRWVPTDMNPADAATRVKKIPKITNDSKWLRGPTFLSKSEENWPAASFSFQEETPEEEIKTSNLLNHQASVKSINFNRFSSLFRLKRTIAWVLRSMKLFRTKKGLPPKTACTNTELVPPLLPSEINNAEKYIVKQVQDECFSHEKSLLIRQQPISKRSKIFKLTPFVDNDGIIRASGRLDEALYLPYETRRPIVLPKKHQVSKLIMMHYHAAYHHQNEAIILNAVRQKFWIIGATVPLKSVQRSYMECRLESAKPMPPLMGQLPADHIHHM